MIESKKRPVKEKKVRQLNMNNPMPVNLDIDNDLGWICKTMIYSPIDSPAKTSAAGTRPSSTCHDSLSVSRNIEYRKQKHFFSIRNN
jgi:hypothetical protein